MCYRVSFLYLFMMKRGHEFRRNANLYESENTQLSIETDDTLIPPNTPSPPLSHFNPVSRFYQHQQQSEQPHEQYRYDLASEVTQQHQHQYEGGDIGNSLVSSVTPEQQHEQYHNRDGRGDIGDVLSQNLVSPVIPTMLTPVRGRPKRKDTTLKFNWSDEHVDLLIELWNDREILYDVVHPDYHKKDKKEKIIEEIKTILSDKAIYVEVNGITAKFTSLKSYFCQERGKIAASKTSGSGTNDVYISRWKFFSSLDFFGDSMTPRNVYSSLSDVELPTAAKKTKTLKKQRMENGEKLMETAVECLKTPGTTSSSLEKSE